MVLLSAPAGAGVLAALLVSALAPVAGAFVASPPGTSGRPGAELHTAPGQTAPAAGADGQPAAAAAGAGAAAGVGLGLCACAAALLARTARAPKKVEQRLVAVRAFESETGVQAPVGFWDPLGLSSDGSAFNFARRREVELKHGRVSMFATIGYMVPEYYKLPGFLSPSYGVEFADVPNGLGALSKVPALGWLQIVLLAGVTEIQIYKDTVNGEPGNYGAGFLGSKSIGLSSNGFTDPEYRKSKLNAELANGRLAMMAIIGMFFQDGLTGSAWGDWANYTDSPLRAFESETGVQAPVGFWDPLGLSSDGSAFNFARRREVELKHGRVSMFATIGYMVPEYYKLPGFLSPSYGVEFADVPNGLGALSKVPALGWLQIVLLAGVTEIQIYKDTVNGEPGNYGAGFLGSKSIGFSSNGFTDPEYRKMKLNAELANGRLAMMAIIGMFFQDGLTGSAWGDWANYTDSPLR